jgi:CBS domain-containing protein
MVNVSSIMVTADNICTIDEDKTLHDVAKLLLEKKVSNIVITEKNKDAKDDEKDFFLKNKPVGFIGKSDILSQYVILSDENKLTCKEFMNKNLEFVEEKQSISEVAEILLNKGVTQVLVVNDKKIVVGYVEFLGNKKFF